jgi:hypothetical protein
MVNDGQRRRTSQSIVESLEMPSRHFVTGSLIRLGLALHMSRSSATSSASGVHGNIISNLQMSAFLTLLEAANCRAVHTY